MTLIDPSTTNLQETNNVPPHVDSENSEESKLLLTDGSTISADSISKKNITSDGTLDSISSGKTANYRVFVARIPGNTTTEDLKDYFSQFGEIRTIKLDKRSNGRCSGSGSFAISSKEGYDAICAEKHVFKGRKIVATQFLDKSKTGTDTNVYHKRKAVLTKVPPHITVENLKSALEVFGPVENLFQVRVSDPSMNKNIIQKNRTFQVIFKNLEDTKKLILLNGKLQLGSTATVIKVRLFFKKSQIEKYKNQYGSMKLTTPNCTQTQLFIPFNSLIVNLCSQQIQHPQSYINRQKYSSLKNVLKVKLDERHHPYNGNIRLNRGFRRLRQSNQFPQAFYRQPSFVQYLPNLMGFY